MQAERISRLPVPAEAELPEDVQALFERAHEKLGFVPNVFRVFAFRPQHLVKWRSYYDELLRGESGLTHAQREMIAVVVSAENRCYYCLTSHGAALRQLTEDPVLADQLAANYRHAERLTAKERAMLDFAVKVTASSETCSEADLERLREAGWSDEEIMDMGEVAAMFNFTNRLANAFGWVPNAEYHSLGR
jgi:uncharacterized peroxidase-related enzyme